MVYAKAIQIDSTIKVGVYELEPYFMVDESGTMSGYYYDFMNLLQKRHSFQYEFVVVSLSEGLNKLVDGDLDIMLGIAMNNQLEESLIFNRYSTNKEIFGIFCDENMNFDEMSSMTNLKVGMVEGDSNAQMVLNLFQANHIDVSIIYEKDYKTLEKRLEDNTIDVIIENKWKEKDYTLLYEFIGRDVYIAGNKESEAILEYLDQAMEQSILEKQDTVEVLSARYFESPSKPYEKMIISVICFLCLVLAIVTLAIVHKKLIKYKIRLRLKRNQYILQYQPIYDPRTNRIVGFEGLLRLLDKNQNLIPPLKIIPEIEKNDMLYEVTIGMMKRVIKDYDEIKSFDTMKGKDFYLSINLSLKEIENDAFVDHAIHLLTQSELGKDKICLEIVERFKMEDIDKLTHNIQRLKQAGYKLAIDDFGVEYSNLDIFQKLNVDIIKVDKIFVDGIGKDDLIEEVVLFISRLAHLRCQSVVLEGVEEYEQVSKIKEIDNERLYVQGFYYQKPMNIEHIKMLAT